MVNYCVCGGCTNSSRSGHRVHRFPNREKNGAIFRAWVRFVQLKRRDFSSASATKNAVVCGAHFRPEDYHPGDLLEFNVGCRSKNQVRLAPGAVPSVPTASSGPPSAAAAGAAVGGRHGHGSGRDSARRKRELCTHFVRRNGPTKEHPDPIPAEGITDRRRIPRKKRPRERANRRTFPPSRKVRPQQENTLLNTDASEDVNKTEVTVSTLGLDSRTEGAYIVVSINQSQMASPSYRAMRLGMYDSFSDPYSESETFPPAVQCLSPVPSSGEVKAEFEFEGTNYTLEEPKERFMKSEGMKGGIEWNCAGGMMEERRRLFNIKEEEESMEMVKVRMEENLECGMTTEEKCRMYNLKVEEEDEDEDVKESEEKRFVKIEREEDVGENMGFRIKKEEVIDEYEENSGTDLNFPTYRFEGKGGESEYSQQEGESSLSSLVTECLLRQRRSVD